MTITQVKESLSAMLHGGSLKRVRNIEALFERAANNLLSNIDPIDTIRTQPLSNTVHDDIYNYSLPSDYKKIIDLFPQSGRESSDAAKRRFAQHFSLQKALNNKSLSIEGEDGSKLIKINWRSRQGKVFNSMDSLTANGTWAIVGTATGLVIDDITKFSGNASVRFDLAASNDGIQNSDMSELDLTDEDEVADAFIRFYIKNAVDLAKVTSLSFIWGNDLTTNYWTGVAQTVQADGTAFRVGWNEVRIPWSTATETGTVTPSTIDSGQVTFATTGAISDIRVDSIVFSIGRNFDIKYYSKFILKNSAGTWITRTSDDSDTVVLDNDAINIFLYESLIEGAQQVEGVDSTFDLNYAEKQLKILYKKYKGEYPSQSKKAIAYYASKPGRRRW